MATHVKDLALYRLYRWSNISLCLPPRRSIILHKSLGHDEQQDVIHMEYSVSGALELCLFTLAKPPLSLSLSFSSCTLHK